MTAAFATSHLGTWKTITAMGLPDSMFLLYTQSAVVPWQGTTADCVLEKHAYQEES